MIIDKYINWNKLFKNEISIEAEMGFLDPNEKDPKKYLDILKKFIIDKDVILNTEECFINKTLNNELEFVFCFSETKGQNESDNQVYSRDYFLTFSEDLEFVSAYYEQG